MKFIFLIIGVFIGAAAGFLFARNNSDEDLNSQVHTAVPKKWDWSDSIDAAKAAPESHQIVFEDSSIRILKVLLAPGKTEPVHTHRWRSVMWFTQATPMTYYQYGSGRNAYVLKDSMSIPQMPAEVIGRGEGVDAEGPHAIRNTGTEEGIAYRVEFKKEFKP